LNGAFKNLTVKLKYHGENSRAGDSMAKEKTTLPPTGAGLMRFFDEDTRAIKVSPKGVIAMTLILIAVEFLLHAFGSSIFG
jgi:preprotein translocase subunit Sec61beta